MELAMDGKAKQIFFVVGFFFAFKIMTVWR